MPGCKSLVVLFPLQAEFLCQLLLFLQGLLQLLLQLAGLLQVFLVKADSRNLAL